MPRRRHEEERSSSSRSSPPRTERRSSSSPRPAAARSRSRENTGRSAPRPSPRPAPAAAASTSRSSSQPRPAPAAAPVAASAPRSSPQPRPAPARSSSPHTERSTPRTYRTSTDDDSYRVRSDDEYSLFGGILSAMRRASRDDQARATSHGESLFGDTVRILLCPPPPVVSEPRASSDSESRFLTFVRAYCAHELWWSLRLPLLAPVAAPVAVPVSLCDTQDKAFKDCLHDFETDISKCQLYMNMLSRCKRNSDSKLEA